MPTHTTAHALPEPRIDLLWPQVHTLTLLAQLSSFTQAAQRLGVSKAAVSQRITELERAIGQPLVQRTTRSVRLTEAGQALVDRTTESFAHIARSVGQARDLAAEPRGLLRVTVPVALGHQHVATLIQQFARLHPDIRIELDLSDRLVTLAHEGFDLAVRHTSTPPDNHVAWKLCDTRTLLVASQAYLRRQGTPVHPSELAQHACLPYLRSGPATWKFERAAPTARTTGPRSRGLGSEPERVSLRVQGPFRANNSEIVRDAALAGLGLALLPDFSAAAAIRAGKLQVVLPHWKPLGFFGDSVHAIRPWSPTTPKAVQALALHLRDKLQGGFPLQARA